MATFLFRFGFCTPAQWKANEENGWDDESSDALFIDAPTVEAAEVWGSEVAEFLTRRLFEESDWTGQIPSWKDSGFAFWVEEGLDSLPREFLNERFTVAVGEFPGFVEWREMLFGPPENI